MSRRNRRLARLAAPIAGALFALFSAAPGDAEAQQNAAEWLERCRQSDRGDRAVHCDVRETTLPALRSLNVDARPNGGVQVRAWDRSDIQVVAKIQAYAPSAADARELASQIQVQTANGTVRATGPDTRGDRRSWSVSYEVSVPRSIDLTLESQNGGLSVGGVRGRLSLSTQNGGIALDGVGGDVRGETTNGGLSVRLAGDRWAGDGLDLRTTNGGISLSVPSAYSARLVTSTVNGGFNSEIPLTVQGQIGRRIEANLGQGGAPIRLATTNGGVKIRRD